MISNKWKKHIKSLQIKKYRKEHQAFLVEGEKSVLELLHSDLIIEKVWITEDIDTNSIPNNNKQKLEITDGEQINSCSSLKNNRKAIAIVQIPKLKTLGTKGITFILDDIQDPGNLGTIIRIADWFGINNIVCSENSVDFFNPKTISATKGSFIRVQPYYVNLENYLKDLSHDEVYAADMEGTQLQEFKSSTKDCAIIFGNEANGVSTSIQQFIKSSITIPRIGHAESLNVAISTALFAFELTKKKLKLGAL